MASFGAGAANFAGHALSSTVDLAIKAADGGPYQPTAPSLSVANPFPCNNDAYIAGGVAAGIAGLLIHPEAGVAAAAEGGALEAGDLVARSEQLQPIPEELAF